MWDEENRIRAISDNGAFYHYIYDAAGERVLKGQSTGQRIFVNGQWKAGSGQMGNYTVYVNPYLVLKSGGYTKHFYIEGQRIVSKLGGGWNNTGSATQAGATQVDYSAKGKRLLDGIVKNLKFLGADGSVLTAGKSGKVPPGQVNGTGNVTEAFRYFYHPDHLGSTSYVTDASGEVYQHLEYFAFGETFVEEHSNTSRIPYLFNGKELDEETGLYNYGLRYYDPRMSVWLSVDPMAEKYASSTPYAYTLNNPLNLIDPNGMEAKPTPIHQSIIESAQRWAYNESTVGWTTGDIVKWKTNGGNAYLFERKAQFVGYYKNVIKDAAKTYDIPEFLLAGVAYTEFGGDPMWIDDAADATRSFDWGGPDWVDNNLTMTSHPDKTSMGNLSIQIRTAAEALGYDPKNLSSDDRAKIIESLKDPVQNIYIAAKHLSDLRNVDAKGKASSQMTKGDIKNAATRYNRGSGLSLNKILQNLSYGKSIYKHEKEINDALNK